MDTPNTIITSPGQEHRRGTFFAAPILVLSGFSGCGKGTILQQFCREGRTVQGKPIQVVTSYTTRQPRSPWENYHFVSKEAFQAMAHSGQFLEFNDSYSGHSYGTPIRGIQDALDLGAIPCLEIDYSGLKRLLAGGMVNPKLVVSVFIAAPAGEVYDRLSNRKTEMPAEIRDRLERAMEEAAHIGLYRYVLVNNDVGQTVEQLQQAFELRLGTHQPFDAARFRRDMACILKTL